MQETPLSGDKDKTSRRIRSALTANSYEGKEILNEEPYLHIIHMQNGNEEIRTPAPFMAYLVSNQTSSTDLEYISDTRRLFQQLTAIVALPLAYGRLK